MSKLPPEPQLPPQPEQPDPSECCGSGCIPCIMDLYEEKLAEWGEEVARIKAEHERALRRAREAGGVDA